MRHLGDITKIDWSAVEPVDVVTGGSPCQDLSVAGKRAGLAGERSGLFMEQIRCIKELREQDVLRGRSGKSIRPRFMVWENVPGAFSSGRPKGADFAAVIEEIVKIVESEATYVSVPEKGWPKSGCFYDEMGRWSVAWRVHDAQFWGVPQRRKRIALVADFGGLAAPEILFERKGLSGHSEQSGTQREETAGAVGGGVEGAGAYCLQGNGIDRADTAGCNGKGWREDVSYTLNTIDRPAVYSFDSLASNSMKSSNPHSGCRQVEIAKTLDCFDPNPSKNQGGIAVVCAGFKHKQGALAGNIGYQEEQAPTLNAEQQSAVYDARGNGDGQTVCTLTGDHQNMVTDYTALCVGNGQLNQMSMGEQANTLDTMHDQQAVLINSFAAGGYGKYEEGVGTLRASGGDYGGGTETLAVSNVVRRLTPLECTRLQGFPDGWVDIGDWVDSKGKKHKDADSPKYKALGNSIALPFWKWLLKRISAQYERDATLGSLFDGIGGFPLVWEQINGKGSARWASEIEEFPIAVTKLRFKEEQ